MRTYSTVLVAIDFSDCSQELVDQALAVTAPSSRIVLLHVAELPDGLGSAAEVGAEGEGGQPATAQAVLTARSLRRLEGYRREMSTTGQRVELEVGAGPIAETIVARAQHHQAELIVMGTHGRRGLSLLVGGSVAAQVVTLAECPVLTLRTQHKPTCRAHSCDSCDSHLTPELRQLMVERDG